MQLTEEQLTTLVKEAVKTTLEELGIGKQEVKQERNAYQKTELLLWNYKGFKKVIADKKEQIEEIRKHGVPHKGGAVHSYGGNALVSEMRTEEEAVEDAVTAIKHSMREVVNVVNMIDNAMANLKNDPYYNILEMRYFEGMGQEDIGKALKCTQPNVSYHKNRLIRELSVQMFPNEVAKELLQ